MAVDPNIIPAGAFEIQFSEGKQIEGSNMYTGYIGSIQSNIKVVYHLESQSKDLQWWYEFAMSHCSPYLLRVIGKCQSSSVGKELLFTELVEGTLHDWVKKNPLIDSEYPERLSKPFIGILGDILNGIIYFRCTLRQPHGEICANNVYLVNGNAKLGKALNPKWYEKTFGDDINKFCGMVRSLFKSKGSKLPFGLDHLCRYLQKYIKFEKHLMNAINHPIMLTPDARCEYRLVAYSLVKHHQNCQLEIMVNKRLGQELSPKKNSRWSWMERIHGKEFETILHYQHNQTLPPSPPSQLPPLQFGSLPPPQPQQQMYVQPQQQPPQTQLPQTQPQLPSPSVDYSNTPVSFLKYNRNAVTHVKDYDRCITNDTIDRTLSSFVPEFMPLLHEVLTSLGVFVRPLPVTI
ncbi:hypothetical protein HYC85_011392 [Camellia sinensis]|uniref:Uncharacterized protein n=2 Tax=Camellia sinensis TaxID=4442 RepID=A0A7J7H974_CAMSI|nr:hypothetical protein HYC85_011392 [Camellia sinensis]